MSEDSRAFVNGVFGVFAIIVVLMGLGGYWLGQLTKSIEINNANHKEYNMMCNAKAKEHEIKMNCVGSIKP